MARASSGSRRKTPPRFIVQGQKDHRVILQPLAFMNSHDGNRVDTLKVVERGRPIATRLAGREHIFHCGIDYFGEPISLTILWIDNLDLIPIEKSKMLSIKSETSASVLGTVPIRS